MLTQREYWLAIDSEAVDLAKKGVSDWSPVAEVTVAGDDLAPAAPSISASSADQAIDLELTKPNLNADGTTCVDFKEFKVYHSASSGIDITNPSSYNGHFFTSSTKHTFPTSEKTYFVATAWDKNGNESTPSSEVSATPIASGYSPSVDDYTNNISSVVTGDGLIGIEFQPPKSSWIRWAGWKLYYDVDEGSGWSGTWTLIYTGSGPGFLHKGLNTAYAYKYKLTVLSEDGTETSGTVSDNSGNGYTPNASDNSSLTSVTIFAERIVATDEVRAANIKAGTITADRLAFSAFDKGSDTLDDITDGTTYGRILKTDISAGHILLSETIGDLDDIPDGSTYGRVASTDISAGHITVVSEQASININNSTFGSKGIQLQYNGGTPRAYIGDGSDKYVKFDGTDVTVSGNITIKGGSGISNLSDAGDLATKDLIGASDCDTTIISGGKIITDLLTADNIQTGTLDASVVNVTNLNASNITTGYLSAARIDSGTITADKLNISQLSAISADLGSITSGTITGATVRTSSSDTRAEMSSGSYPFAYYYGGDKKFYVDTSGNVYGKTFKDTNGQEIISGGVFQGIRTIEIGYVGTSASTHTVWSSGSRTVPSNKRWIVVVMPASTVGQTVPAGDMNIGILDNIYFSFYGTFSYTNEFFLPSGTHTTDLKITHEWYIERDDGTSWGGSIIAIYQVLEIPDALWEGHS